MDIARMPWRKVSVSEMEADCEIRAACISASVLLPLHPAFPALKEKQRSCRHK